MPELSQFQIMLLPIVGTIVVILSVLTKVIGMPDQIRLNHKRKSTEGLSLVAYTLSCVTYFFWALYGALRGDWVVFLAHGVLGTLITGFVLFQFYLYRSKDRN